MADEIYEDRKKADKVLTVIAIIGIIVINTILIAKFVRRGNFLYKPKSLTLISLAIGDLLLALFALVINARTIFEGSAFQPHCSTVISAMVYNGNIIHFVYGVGLIVLAVELIQRSRSIYPSGANRNLMKAIIFSSLPWVCALVVMLPLCMAGIDWSNNCNFGDAFPDSRNKAQVWMSIIVPATAALLTCTAISCVRLSADAEDMTQLTLVPSAGEPSSDTKSAPPAGFPQYLSTGQSKEAPGLPETTGPCPETGPQGPSNTVAKRNAERMVLLWVSGIFFACTLPNAFFSLEYEVDGSVNTLDPFLMTSLAGFCSWIMIYRSVLTPFIWIFCSTD